MSWKYFRTRRSRKYLRSQNFIQRTRSRERGWQKLTFRFLGAFRCLGISRSSVPTLETGRFRYDRIRLGECTFLGAKSSFGSLLFACKKHGQNCRGIDHETVRSLRSEFRRDHSGEKSWVQILVTSVVLPESGCTYPANRVKLGWIRSSDFRYAEMDFELSACNGICETSTTSSR